MSKNELPSRLKKNTITFFLFPHLFRQNHSVPVNIAAFVSLVLDMTCKAGIVKENVFIQPKFI